MFSSQFFKYFLSPWSSFCLFNALLSVVFDYEYCPYNKETHWSVSSFFGGDHSPFGSVQTLDQSPSLDC